MKEKEKGQVVVQLIAINTLLIATLRELQEAIRQSLGQEISKFYSQLYEDVGHIVQLIVDKMCELAGDEDTYIVNL